MNVLDLRDAGASYAIDFADPVVLTEEERLGAIETWKKRMINEHISARVFASLIPQMMKAGLPAEWQEQIAIMIQDELRHGQQCAGMVHSLGGDARATMPELPDVPDHDDVGPLECFLRNIISVSCLSETVAVGLIRGEQEDAGPPEMEECLQQILADEVQHARFGWMVLRELSDQLPVEMKQRLSAYLVFAFRSLHEHEMLHLPVDSTPTDAVAQLGVCDGATSREVYFDTVEQVIIPGLEEHGFSARNAWETSLRPLPN
jgi:hypothetical protein